ncbi:MAG: dTDP-4-dehydrorhamnose 3,5-epimerase [Flavobacteriaceae bacterium]
MKVNPTFFSEVLLLKPSKNTDDRGFFIENFNQKIFKKVTGKQINFCQDNLAFSKKGAIRGLHYQLPPFSQSKLVSVIQGTVLDVVVDIRKGSLTFGKHFTQELSDQNHFQLFIPRGFAHGYITLSDTSIFNYKVDNYYHPQSEGSIAPNDPELGIDWNLSEKVWIQSDKDKKHPKLKDAFLFDYNQNLYV